MKSYQSSKLGNSRSREFRNCINNLTLIPDSSCSVNHRSQLAEDREVQDATKECVCSQV